MRLRVMLAMVLAIALAASSALAADSVMLIKDPLGGNYLADSKGMTLYVYNNDMPGMSTCKGICSLIWTAFYAKKLVLPKGLDAEDFGSVKRDDGQMQTTFMGMPLYYFSGDKHKGDMKGAGSNNVWYTFDPATYRKK